MITFFVWMISLFLVWFIPTLVWAIVDELRREPVQRISVRTEDDMWDDYIYNGAPAPFD